MSRIDDKPGAEAALNMLTKIYTHGKPSWVRTERWFGGGEDRLVRLAPTSTQDAMMMTRSITFHASSQKNEPRPNSLALISTVNIDT